MQSWQCPRYLRGEEPINFQSNVISDEESLIWERIVAAEDEPLPSEEEIFAIKEQFMLYLTNDHHFEFAEDECYYGFCFELEEEKINSFCENITEPFSGMVLRFIQEKGKSEVEVYKRAHIDRRTFSRLRSHRYYRPGRDTAICLVIALELNLAETTELLCAAGYTLSTAIRRDLIIAYFIAQKKYSIMLINEVLYAYDELPLDSMRIGTCG